MAINEKNPNIRLIVALNKYNTSDIVKMTNLTPNTHIDVIFGGSSCQTFSTTGNRKGFDASRRNILLDYLDSVGNIKLTYVIIKNIHELLYHTPV